jgi:hypothetical protein
MSGSRPPAHYEIRIEGVLGERWTGWFEGLQVSSEAGETIISGPVTDQPALHGGPSDPRDPDIVRAHQITRRAGQPRARTEPGPAAGSAPCPAAGRLTRPGSSSK